MVRWEDWFLIPEYMVLPVIVFLCAQFLTVGWHLWWQASRERDIDKRLNVTLAVTIAWAIEIVWMLHSFKRDDLDTLILLPSMILSTLILILTYKGADIHRTRGSIYDRERDIAFRYYTIALVLLLTFAIANVGPVAMR